METFGEFVRAFVHAVYTRELYREWAQKWPEMADTLASGQYAHAIANSIKRKILLQLF